MAAPPRQYGLILPKAKQNSLALSKHSIFNDSDDETSVSENLQKESLKKRMMKQTKLEIQKALAEDVTVYEYDSIYDDLQQKKLESHTKLLSGSNKQSKYIESLLKAVDERKKEQDRRMERKIQKEREAEGEKYVDKDAFVTSAYKKKLQERAEEKEQERREAELEASLDVTKQKDLSGFYRHFLNQKVGEEIIPECSIRGTKGIKEEPEDNNGKNPDGFAGWQDLHIDSDSEINSGEETKPKHGQKQVFYKTRHDEDNSDINEEKARSRQYRRRVESSSEEEQSHQHLSYSSREGKSEKGKSNSKTYRETEKSSSVWGKSTPKEHKRAKERHREKDHPRKEREQERYRDSKDQKRTKEEKSKDHNSGRDGRPRDSHKDKVEQVRDEKFKEREQNKMEKCPIKDGKRKEEKHRNQERRERDKEIQEEVVETFERGDEKDGSHDSPGNTSEKEKSRKPHHKRPRSEEKDEQRNDEGNKTFNWPCEQKSKVDSEKETNGTIHSQQLSKFVKRSNQETITSAKERYLARQISRASTKSYIEPEEND
ncbi:nuclear speckle splicing regulatory protein 1 isoform X1 [Narcine bancroftii]|uniref:nuclear speckle splicing regulatory protein 1 isoform X1 n=3 Tax=Narcine bancroftii TaxID=1343680 RepID=UPI0038318B6D